MPNRTSEFTVDLAIQHVYNVLSTVLARKQGVRKLESDAQQFRISFRVGAGWGSASALSSNSAAVVVQMQSVNTLQTQVSIKASSKAVLDLDNYLGRVVQQTEQIVRQIWHLFVTQPCRPIFISYRRNDTGDMAGRIYDRLVQYFGVPNVFKDTHAIPPAVDFRVALERLILDSKAFVAVIGRNWTKVGDRDISDPDDIIRAEIEVAFEHKVPILPLLVNGAVMPRPEQLPESIRQLAYLNALTIRGDPYFHTDIVNLIAVIEQVT